MGAVLVFALFLGPSIGVLWWTVRFACQPDTRIKPRQSLALLGFVGLVLGYSLADSEYAPSPRTKVIGIPLPLAIFKLESGNWVDYVYDPAVAYALFGTNMICWVAATVSPLTLHFLWIRMRQSQAAG
jgi:hypothetical protein